MKYKNTIPAVEKTLEILEYLYPQIPNHPTQAYKVTEYGKKWLESSNE